jgi:peptidoglycan/LPS O-acetylase OafA/YrhL
MLLLLISAAAFLHFGSAASSSGFERVVTRGLPALGITTAILALDRSQVLRWIPRAVATLLLVLGDASYSIYLSHLYALRFFSDVWQRLHLAMVSPAQAATYVLLCIVFGTAAGLAVWRFIELPTTRWVRHFARKRALAAA